MMGTWAVAIRQAEMGWPCQEEEYSAIVKGRMLLHLRVPWPLGKTRLRPGLPDPQTSEAVFTTRLKLMGQPVQATFIHSFKAGHVISCVPNAMTSKAHVRTGPLLNVACPHNRWLTVFKEKI